MNVVGNKLTCVTLRWYRNDTLVQSNKRVSVYWDRYVGLGVRSEMVL